MTAVVDPLGNQTSITYNASGLPVSVTDPLGNSTQFGHDGADLVSVTDPLGNTTTQFVDGVGRVAAVTDPLGRNTRYTYNALNEIVQMTDPLQGVTSFSYDQNGNPVSLTNPLGNSVTWTYDNMDRVATFTDSLLRAQGSQYDVAGNLATFTDRKGQVTTYQYDRLNRLTFAGFGTQGNGGAATYSSTVSLQYDANNRLTQAVDSIAGTITHSFDTLDRLTSEVTPQGSITYSYDAAGRRTGMTVGGQTAIAYSYDNADRLTQITQGSATVGFGYDTAGRRTSLNLPDGITVSYSYDNASQTTGISYQAGNSMLGNLNYVYDQLGRRIQTSGSFARTSLPSPVVIASHDAANELTNWNGLALSYDANGNMLSDGTNAFSWDARNQLSTMNGSSLQYDALGRRTRNAAGTSFLYDTINSIQEMSGSTVTANMLTGGVDELFTRSNSSGSFTILSDALGSSLAAADAAGTIQAAYSYDPFGVTSASGLPGINEFQFTGRENERNGLYYYRARYYSPALGRFISEDPIGFAGGDANLYAYVRNNPISFRDPTGRWLIGAIVGGVAGGVEGALGARLQGGSTSDIITSAIIGAVLGGALGALDPTEGALTVGELAAIGGGGGALGDAIGQVVANFGRSCKSYNIGQTIGAGLGGAVGGGMSAWTALRVASVGGGELAQSLAGAGVSAAPSIFGGPIGAKLGPTVQFRSH
jgi:RHS repeat-associated protein